MPNTWPGREHAGQRPTPSKRAAAVEQAILEDVSTVVGHPPRFAVREACPLFNAWVSTLEQQARP